MAGRIRRIAFVVVLCGWGAAVTAQDRMAEELARLQGGWGVMAAEQSGRAFDAIAGGGLVIEGRTFFLRTAAGNEFRGEIRIDPSRSPAHLDFVHADGGPVWEAIYTVDEEVLRLNYVEAGGAASRPSIFATSSDGGGTLILLNRLVPSGA